MRKISALLSLVIVCALTAQVVQAQTTLEANSASPASQPRDRMISVPPTSRTPISQQLQTTAPELRMDNTLRGKIEARRMAAKEAAIAKRTQLKTQLSNVTNAQKKAAVSRIDSSLETVHTKTTDTWIAALGQMTAFLDRAGSKSAEMSAVGMNTVAVDAAITRARASVTTAETAVTTQAGKSYVPMVSTESALSTSVGATVSQMRQDLRVTHQTVVTARQSVASAVRALKAMEKAEISVSSTKPSSASNSAM